MNFFPIILKLSFSKTLGHTHFIYTIFFTSSIYTFTKFKAAAFITKNSIFYYPTKHLFSKTLKHTILSPLGKLKAN